MQFVLLYINEGCDPVNKFYYCDISTLPGGIQGCKEQKRLPFIKLIDSLKIFGEIVVPGFDQTEFHVSQVSLFKSYSILPARI